MALARVRWPVPVLSAGLSVRAGEPAADHARVVARERGGDLESHRSQVLEQTLVAKADWLIGMTRSHVAIMSRHLDAERGPRLGLLGAPGRDLRGMATPEVEEVADPFGADLATYRATADQISRLLTAWMPFITSETTRGKA